MYNTPPSTHSNNQHQHRASQVAERCVGSFPYVKQCRSEAGTCPLASLQLATPSTHKSKKGCWGVVGYNLSPSDIVSTPSRHIAARHIDRVQALPSVSALLRKPPSRCRSCSLQGRLSGTAPRLRLACSLANTSLSSPRSRLVSSAPRPTNCRTHSQGGGGVGVCYLTMHSEHASKDQAMCVSESDSSTDGSNNAWLL